MVVKNEALDKMREKAQKLFEAFWEKSGWAAKRKQLTEMLPNIKEIVDIKQNHDELASVFEVYTQLVTFIALADGIREQYAADILAMLDKANVKAFGYQVKKIADTTTFDSETVKQKFASIGIDLSIFQKPKKGYKSLVECKDSAIAPADSK